ncbi:hypothetical protein OUZ56_014541 [Daphnia magna]|uniref:Uncharacterized protein n=1 Tax=Daphnia magna TaxID=35525 RepID=A0ABR0AK29_9CRUS|nr:hypothetical protein OUZ56_014541 [Daphnia magna]
MFTTRWSTRIALKRERKKDGIVPVLYKGLEKGEKSITPAETTSDGNDSGASIENGRLNCGRVHSTLMAPTRLTDRLETFLLLDFIYGNNGRWVAISTGPMLSYITVSPSRKKPPPRPPPSAPALPCPARSVMMI